MKNLAQDLFTEYYNKHMVMYFKLGYSYNVAHKKTMKDLVVFFNLDKTKQSSKEVSNK